MSYFGDIRLGDTIDIKFTTVNTSGVPTALVSGTISAYVGNSTTEITAGITLSTSFDSRTGLNNVRVVASSGNGYAAQTNVTLVITVGTVDGLSVVGYEIGSFSIENRSALMPTTALRTLDVSSNGNAGIDWANIDSPSTAQNLSATNIDVDQVIASVSGSVDSVTDPVDISLTALGEIEDIVWDADLSNHLNSGSTGAALNAAGAAGDPWSTSLPGAYGPGTAGDIIGNNLDASVSSRLASADITLSSGQVTVGTNNDKTGYGLANNSVNTSSIANGALTPAKVSSDFFDAVWSVSSRTLTAFGFNVGLADDAITSAKFDESTAFPISSVDSGSTRIARTGADSDTLETLSDQLDLLQTTADNIEDVVDNTGVIVAINNDKTGYSIGVGGISSTSFASGAIDSAALAQSAGQEIADEFLNRNLAGSGSGNTKNVRNALRALRNRVDGSTGTLTVYQEDDTTPAWTAALTRTPADPIVEVSP